MKTAFDVFRNGAFWGVFSLSGTVIKNRVPNTICYQFSLSLDLRIENSF